jgi:hypothetical protein
MRLIKANAAPTPLTHGGQCLTLSIPSLTRRTDRRPPADPSDPAGKPFAAETGWSDFRPARVWPSVCSPPSGPLPRAASCRVSRPLSVARRFPPMSDRLSASVRAGIRASGAASRSAEVAVNRRVAGWPVPALRGTIMAQRFHCSPPVDSIAWWSFSPTTSPEPWPSSSGSSHSEGDTGGPRADWTAAPGLREPVLALCSLRGSGADRGGPLRTPGHGLGARPRPQRPQQDGEGGQQGHQGNGTFVMKCEVLAAIAKIAAT